MLTADSPHSLPAGLESRTGTPLQTILKTRIETRGPITFAEFMEACLYHPEFGYYTRQEQRPLDDYYTSVDMHPIFGRLLARQFAEMWELLDKPGKFFLVECGAGVGRLASQILDFAHCKLPEFYGFLHYVAVERSPHRQALQAERMGRHVSAGKCSVVAELPARIPAGCIFSNELLDAFPVHRVRQKPHGLIEIFVDWREGKFVETEKEPCTPRLAEYFSEQGITLAEGAEAEVNLAACDWILQAGASLGRGFVLTIDYGHEARELYNERHSRGTLLAYSQHRAHENYFARPGEQDLTSHVNFSALELCGQKAGLEKLGLVSQSHFLMALGKQNEFADLYDEGMTESQQVQARLKLKSLIFPEGMGETFSVVVQAKGIAGAKLSGLGSL